MKGKKLSDIVYYLPSVEEPLSSDVFVVEGSTHYYVFDAGFCDESTEYVNSLDKPVCLVISHFHNDHAGNLGKTKYESLYVGNYTAKKWGAGTVVDKPVTISDGVEIAIYPIAASHAKGSLAMMVNNEILMLGDAAYPCARNDETFYNTQLLLDELSLLKGLPADKYLLSHRGYKFINKAVIIRMLETTYQKRDENASYIYTQ